MGDEPDTDIASFLRKQEERAAREAAAPKSAGWRWSRSGWGDWRAQKRDASSEASSDPADTKD